jgi:hypothetical protein
MRPTRVGGWVGVGGGRRGVQGSRRGRERGKEIAVSDITAASSGSPLAHVMGCGWLEQCDMA